MLPMRIISSIMNFYCCHAIPLKKLSNERSSLAELTEVIIIRNLRMCIISDMNFYRSYAIASPFKKCPMNVLISLAEFQL